MHYMLNENLKCYFTKLVESIILESWLSSSWCIELQIYLAIYSFLVVQSRSSRGCYPSASYRLYRVKRLCKIIGTIFNDWSKIKMSVFIFS